MPELDEAIEHEVDSNESAKLAHELRAIHSTETSTEHGSEGLDPPKGRLDGITAGPQPQAEIPAPPEHTGIVAARTEVAEALDRHEVEQLITGIKFPAKDTKFSLASSFHYLKKGHGSAIPGGSTVSEGSLYGPQNWLNAPNYPGSDGVNAWHTSARQEAHSTGEPVEQAGVRTREIMRAQEKTTKFPRKGLAGLVGLKYSVSHTDYEPTGQHEYFFDYEYAAPNQTRAKDEAALVAGNNTGQEVSLSVRISEDQAKSLSEVLRADPTAARLVLDEYMRKTDRDMGKWNAEIYDETGTFHDPAERYPNDEFVARDVRPNYEAVPDLKPEIVGLVGIDEAKPAAA